MTGTMWLQVYSYDKGCGADRNKFVTEFHNAYFISSIGDTMQWKKDLAWWSGRVVTRSWNHIDGVVSVWLENTVRISK